MKIDESRLPDGGWGWMIVLGVALTNMCNQSLVSVFGLLFGTHLEEMGYGTTGITLVSNGGIMIMCFSGLIIGPLLERYTCRSIAIFGSILTSVGLIMCSFATTITHLLICYSFFAGLGLGLIYPTTFVVIKSYFASRRARAVGLSLAGTGIGQMLMPQLVRWLLDEFGFRWAVRIIGALSLHGAVGSMLYQPVNWHLKPNPKDTQKLLNNNEVSLQIDKADKQKKKSLIQENGKIVDENAIIIEKKFEFEHKEEAASKYQPWYRQLHINILSDCTFLNICCGLGLVHTAGVSFSTIFPLLLQEGPVLRLSRGDTAMAMSILSGADILSRVTIPWFMWKCRITSRIAFFWGALLLAGARSVVALQTSLTGILCASLVCGYIRAMTVINQNLCISEYCSKNGLDSQMPAALGLMMVVKGFFVISVGQFLGWLRDYTGSYTLFVYASNVLLVIVFVAWAVEFVIRKIIRSNAR